MIYHCPTCGNAADWPSSLTIWPFCLAVHHDGLDDRGRMMQPATAVTFATTADDPVEMGRRVRRLIDQHKGNVTEAASALAQQPADAQVGPVWDHRLVGRERYVIRRDGVEVAELSTTGVDRVSLLARRLCAAAAELYGGRVAEGL